MTKHGSKVTACTCGITRFLSVSFAFLCLHYAFNIEQYFFPQCLKFVLNLVTMFHNHKICITVLVFVVVYGIRINGVYQVRTIFWHNR